MSRLSDYSKFDHINDDDSSSDEAESHEVSKKKHAPSQPSVPEKMGVTKKTDDGRYVFECGGRKIYEWEQTLEEVSMYINAPPGIEAHQIECNISTARLKIGRKGSDRFFIDEATFGKVKAKESSWFLDDSGVINIILAKVFRAETWDSALLGQDGKEAVDPFTKQQMQKDLMLERFQEENPGFDFRGAEFNGEAPDPRTFMGGVRYT